MTAPVVISLAWGKKSQLLARQSASAHLDVLFQTKAFEPTESISYSITVDWLKSHLMTLSFHILLSSPAEEDSCVCKHFIVQNLLNIKQVCGLVVRFKCSPLGFGLAVACRVEVWWFKSPYWQEKCGGDGEQVTPTFHNMLLPGASVLPPLQMAVMSHLLDCVLPCRFNRGWVLKKLKYIYSMCSAKSHLKLSII